MTALRHTGIMFLLASAICMAMGAYISNETDFAPRTESHGIQSYLALDLLRKMIRTRSQATGSSWLSV